MNVGASSPSGRGSYFAWGETTPKSNYSWSTYVYGSGESETGTTLTKYVSSSAYGTVDNKSRLDATDDAATQFLGTDWRTPTVNEWYELISTKKNTDDYTWTSGVSGNERVLMITNNSTSATLVLPLAGEYEGESFTGRWDYGYYWSSIRSSTNNESYFAFLKEFSDCSTGSAKRFAGFSIRPVYDPK